MGEMQAKATLQKVRRPYTQGPKKHTHLCHTYLLLLIFIESLRRELSSAVDSLLDQCRTREERRFLQSMRDQGMG